MAYEKMDQFEKAKEKAEKAIEIYMKENKDQDQILYNARKVLYRCYKRTNQLDKAKEELEKRIEIAKKMNRSDLITKV